jgi:DNA polymerase III sliding clamp (beta) subunit (PCNA family)
MIIPAKYKPEFCVSRDASRQIITHLYLRRNFLYATDGKTAVQIQVTLEDDDVDGFIPISVLKEVRSVQKRKRNGRFTPAELHISCKADKLSFNSRFGLIEIKRENPGNYPEMKHVMGPTAVVKKSTVALNVKRLYAIAEALGQEEVTLSFSDSDPIIVTPSGTNLTATHAVLMPSRIS